jgi:hypothetical protein
MEHSKRDLKMRQLRRYICGLDQGKPAIFWKRQIYGLWMLVVTEYTRRDLTAESDRVAALSGIRWIRDILLSSHGTYGL